QYEGYQEGIKQGGGLSAGIFGAANRLNPLYGLGCTGADVYNAVAEGDDEKLGRAVEKLAVAAVGVVVAGRLARGAAAERGGANPATRAAASRGSKLHSDKPGHL